MQDLEINLSTTQNTASSAANEDSNPHDDSAIYVRAAITESLQASLSAPIQGSSLTGDLHHLASLLNLRINADNDEQIDAWLDLEIEERILLIQSYDPDYVTTQMSRAEAEKGVEMLKAARNALRYSIPEGVNRELGGVILLVDGLVERVEENENTAFWQDARRKLEGLGR